eukprot:TRINITY_DN51610_c0_g1_i1.p1 TRINITY_DN51610_c0_g1~~TRINITY_DN51610_c0_g1_i1.p1  ORF type:complete len:255 (+),score=91.53 TRINITY_DN51610_c0_g1_i1:81-767(+)
MATGDGRGSPAPPDDPRLHQALIMVRRAADSDADMELKESCLRQEWEQAASDEDRDLLFELVQDGTFWTEVAARTQDEMNQASDEVWDEARFRQMFRDFDEDKSGNIDISELRALLKNALRLDCSEAEVRGIMGTIDKDGNAGIDEDEFIEIMNAARRQQEESGGRSADSPPTTAAANSGVLRVDSASMPSTIGPPAPSVQEASQRIAQSAERARRLSRDWEGKVDAE